MRFHSAIVLLLALVFACTTGNAPNREITTELRGTVVPAIVIPGFGVSRLLDPGAGRYVWGTPRSLVHRGYHDDLDLPWDAARGRFTRDSLVPSGFTGSRGPINTAWHLSEGLRRGGYRPSYQRSVTFENATVYPFAWDWRLSFDDNTVQLDSFIEDIRRAHGNPDMKVDLVTHSAGAFVALLYLRIGIATLDQPERWTPAAMLARAKVRRVVLVAPPQQGVTDPLRINVQPEQFVRRVFFPELAATWPSVPQLLPDDGRFVLDEEGREIGADLHTIEGWRQLQTGVFDPDVKARVIRSSGLEAYEALAAGFARSLELAGRFREAMAQSLPPGVPVSIIAGDCAETPRRALRRGDHTYAFYRRQLRPDEQHLATLLLEAGDGTVPISSATRHGTEAADRFCIGHQSLAGNPAVHRAILRALQ